MMVNNELVNNGTFYLNSLFVQLCQKEHYSTVVSTVSFLVKSITFNIQGNSLKMCFIHNRDHRLLLIAGFNWPEYLNQNILE